MKKLLWKFEIEIVSWLTTIICGFICIFFFSRFAIMDVEKNLGLAAQDGNRNRNIITVSTNKNFTLHFTSQT